MTKLAVFVEGQTEQLFVERLLKDIAGSKKIAIQSVQGFGGATCPRTYTTITAANIAGHKYYALIYDSSCDGRVVTDIRDQYNDLVAQGFSLILGLRDVFPLHAAQIEPMRAAMLALLPMAPVPTRVILAVMEIEAWFLAEDRHFSEIDARLTAAHVQQVLHARGEIGPVESVPHPTETLQAIYTTAGKHYTKDRRKISSIVGKLDTARLYLELPDSIPALRELCTKLNEFFV